MRRHQWELAAEYLLMAAVLIEIKSRMLLPRPPERVDEEGDPRAELVRRLLDYEQMKLAAQRLDELPQAGRDFSPARVWIDQTGVRRLPDVSVDDLRNTWLALLARSRMNRRHRITREELSVRAHMSRILRHLQGHPFVEFAQLFSPDAGVAEVVVTFLALLELVRENQIMVTQPQPFGVIYVKPAGFPVVA
jgi:segregation and condensation protein A